MDNLHEIPPTYLESIQDDNFNDIHLPQFTNSLEDEKINEAFNLSLTIKYLTLIDCFFCLINSFFYFPLVYFMIFPMLGYYGVSIYNRYITLCYAFINIFLIIYRMWVFVNINFFNYKIFLIFTIIVSLFIIKISLKFFKFLGELETEQIEQLKSGYVPILIKYIWY